MQKLGIKSLSLGLGTSFAAYTLFISWAATFGWRLNVVEATPSLYTGFAPGFLGGIIGALFGALLTAQSGVRSLLLFIMMLLLKISKNKSCSM